VISPSTTCHALKSVPAAASSLFADSNIDVLSANGGVRCTATCLLDQLIAPRLYLVRRCSKGRTPICVAPLDVLDCLLLRQWYVSREPPAAARDAALRILRRCTQEGLYIACSCRPDAPMFPPLTGTIELDKAEGIYTAKRLTERTSHDEFCFQSFDVARHVEGPDEVRRVRSPDLLNGHLVGNPTQRREPVSGPMHDQLREHVAITKTTPCGALIYMLTSGGRNKITAVRTYRGEVTAVAAAAKAMFHKKVDTLFVADCLLINPDDPTDPNLLPALFAQSADKWPHGQMQVGWVLLLATGVKKLAAGDCELTVNRVKHWRRSKGKRSRPILEKLTVNYGCPVRVAESEGTCVRAPYLVCLRAELSAEGKPLWIEGFALPVQSIDCWIPTPSIAEREAVGVLRQVAAECDAAGIQHDMEKKVGTIKNDHGEDCEPDFIARKPAETDAEPALVETQKTTSAKYLAGKVKPHRIMADIGQLYIDDRQKYSRRTADDRLRKRLRVFYGLDSGGNDIKPQGD
jgi:hypothetical protein